MFGSRKQQNDDQQPVAVHAVRSATAFAAAQKLWGVNARTVYQDHGSGKELLHFALVNPKTVIWLQHDIGRQDEFELIMSWTDNKTLLAEVFVILPGPEKTGDDSFPRKVFEALLTKPATVPLVTKGTQ